MLQWARRGSATRLIAMVAAILLGAGPAAAELRTSRHRAAQCVLWEHRDMQGARLRMPNGDWVTFAGTNSTAWRSVPSWNDHVSSATVDRGCELQVWEHAESGGASRAWSGGRNGLNVFYVGSRWNDRISSASCVCD